MTLRELAQNFIAKLKGWTSLQQPQQGLIAPIPGEELLRQRRVAFEAGGGISPIPSGPSVTPTPTPDIWQKARDLGWTVSTPTPPTGTLRGLATSVTPTPTPTPTQAPALAFGMGQEPAYIEPTLFDALMALSATPAERRNIAELAGQESSYGYARPNITAKEESYGPFHINLLAGRIDPTTKQAFTRGGAEDIKRVAQYVLNEYRRTGGLGAWNPGAYPFYQEEIPKRAERKRFYRGRSR